MKLSIFCRFGLKTPILDPKIVLWGGEFAPKTGSNINETPKRHTLARVRVEILRKPQFWGRGGFFRFFQAKLAKY